MNADQAKAITLNQTPKSSLTALQSGEPALVNLYCEVTGENESQARNVFISVSADGEESAAPRGK